MLFSKCNLEEKPKIYSGHTLGLFPSFWKTAKFSKELSENYVVGLGLGLVMATCRTANGSHRI